MLGLSHRRSRIPRHRLGSEHSAWMRLYLDENVPVIVASLLSAHGVDCLTARQAGNLSLSDAEQLVFTGMSDVSSSPSTVETFLNWPSTGT